MMIEIDNVCFSFASKPILHNVDFKVQKGELLTILGPNGAGKSTLLRLLRGRLRPDSGEVRWSAGKAHQLSRAQMATLAAVLPQLAAQPFGFSVREIVAMGAFARDRHLWCRGKDHQAVVTQMLAVTDVAHLAEQRVSHLSGGELQRVLLARALAQQTPVLLLDEATSQLDLAHTRSIAKLLYSLCNHEGKTIIQVSHDMELAAEISQRILLLNGHGRVVALGSAEQVLTAENIATAFCAQVQVEKQQSTGNLRIYPAPIK
jgi:iron complex transport system ATP-binding protein